MQKPPRPTVPYLRLVPDVPDAATLLCEPTGTVQADTAEAVTSPLRYSWLTPNPERRLPQTRTLVLCLTEDEALRLLVAWFPMEGTEYQEREEATVTQILGVRWYRVLVEYGYLRVKKNVLGIRMVYLDDARFAVTYPFVTSTCTAATRLRMVHRSDATWRPGQGTWAELLRRAHDDAHLGLPRARGTWEELRGARRTERKECHLLRRVQDARDRKAALLGVATLPSHLLCITLQHAEVLAQFLGMHLEQQQQEVRAIFLSEVLVEKLGRMLVAQFRRFRALSVVDGVDEDGEWFEFNLDVLQHCHIKIVSSEQSGEQLRRLRGVEGLHLPWIYHHAPYRLQWAVQCYNRSR